MPPFADDVPRLLANILTQDEWVNLTDLRSRTARLIERARRLTDEISRHLSAIQTRRERDDDSLGSRHDHAT